MTREEQFRNAVSENGDHIFRICNYYFEDPGDRDDACQESLMRIWQSLPSFRADAKISTWIYRIVVNTCLSFIRQEKKRKIFSPLGQIPQNDSGEPESGKENDETADLKVRFFNEFLRSLQPLDRSLVSLYLEDVSTREMAEITGLSEANARVRIHRIKESVKKQWEEKHNGTR